MLFKKDLLEIIPHLKEIAKDSKSLHNNLKIIDMEECCSIPIINETAINAYENFVNKYISMNGSMKYRNLIYYFVESVTIYSNADSSKRALTMYFCSRDYNGDIAFSIDFNVDGKISISIDTDETFYIGDIIRFIKEELHNE